MIACFEASRAFELQSFVGKAVQKLAACHGNRKPHIMAVTRHLASITDLEPLQL